MKGQVIFEAMTNVRDELITEAAQALGLMGAAPAAKAPAAKSSSSRLSRFFGSGWGVAVICAAVSLSVLGGIIWAGQRPAGGPPVIETVPVTDDETVPETAVPQEIISEAQAIKNASYYHWCIQNGYVDPNTRYTYRIESMGRTQTPDSVAVYEIALRRMLDGSPYSTIDTVWVDVQTGKFIIPYDNNPPAFDVATSLAAIDRLADENYCATIRFESYTSRGSQIVNTLQFGQMDGTYWYYDSTSCRGDAVMEEEGDYYHIFNYQDARWRRITTVTNASAELEKIRNAHNWWKNYLDDLNIDVYDRLVYTGKKYAAGQDCHVYSYEGTLGGLGKSGNSTGNGKLTMYVHAETRNVMRFELNIKYTSDHHTNDIVEASAEIQPLQTGPDTYCPRLWLLLPKRDGPDS